MKYINAKTILPEHLLKELQEYVQGCYLYVPAVQPKQWGEVSGYRRELAERNEKICADQKAGDSVSALAEKYALSESAIRKIIRQHRFYD